MRRGVIAWFVHNPVAANLLMLSIMIAGILSLPQIRKELVPAKEKQTITIAVSYPSASPLEVEESITLKIEEAVKNVNGIAHIEANSFYGRSQVIVDVARDFDTQKLVNSLKIAVDGIKTWPSLAEKPIITQSQYSGLAIQLQLYGQFSESDAKTIATEIKEDILVKTEAKKVIIWGDRPFELAIEVDEKILRQYHLTINDVARKVRMESINAPSGGIASNRGLIVLRVDGQAYRQQDFENIVLLTREDGTVVKLSDVASVKDGFVDYGAKGYFDGQYSLGIAVFAVGNQDISKIAEQVKTYASTKAKQLPAGVFLSDWADVTYYLQGSMSMMIDNLIWGALFILIILLCLLEFRIVFWVVLGLPVCFLGTLFLMPMSWADVSLNLVSLFGFILILGIIVDDAIIIGESVDAEIKQSGFSKNTVIKGVKKVFLPAFFGVLTTVIAFLPLILVQGPWQAAPHAIGFIVIFSLLFSLLESKLILPAHLAAKTTFKLPFTIINWQYRFQQRNNKKLSRYIKRYYQPFLHNCLANRYTTLAVFIGILLISTGLLLSKQVPYILLPAEPSDFLKVKLVMGDGSSQEDIEEARNRISDAIYQVESDYQQEFDTSSKLIKHLFQYNTTSKDAQFTLELTKAKIRQIDSFAIIKAWREKVGSISAVNTLEFSAFTDNNSAYRLSYQLNSRDPLALSEVSNALYQHLKTYKALSNFENTALGQKESLVLALTPKAEAMGLTLSELSYQVHAAFYGAEAQRVLRDNAELKVMVRLPKSQRATTADLLALDIRLPDNRFVPLAELATIKTASLQTNLKRINYQAASFVGARVEKSITSPGEIDKAIKKEFLPKLLEKYPSVSFGSNKSNFAQIALEKDLTFYFIMACLAVFAFLAIPLKSYFQPLIIMTAVPFGVVGAILGHWIMDFPISMMSLFGIIALTGVVVNDSLIMVDFINREQKLGINIIESAKRSGQKRFRAILLTTLTTFAGIIPMMLENAMRVENFIPMAISLGFGIVFATTITLILIPCLYLVMNDVKNTISYFSLKLLN